jgi:hypothetical protein
MYLSMLRLRNGRIAHGVDVHVLALRLHILLGGRELLLSRIDMSQIVDVDPKNRVLPP